MSRACSMARRQLRPVVRTLAALNLDERGDELGVGALAGDERLDGGLLRFEAKAAFALFLGRDAIITDVILAHGRPLCTHP